MRANESLPLTAQADAAFLLKLVRDGADAVRNGAVKDTKQLLRTMRVIKEGVERMHLKA